METHLDIQESDNNATHHPMKKADQNKAIYSTALMEFQPEIAFGYEGSKEGLNSIAQKSNTTLLLVLISSFFSIPRI